MIETVGMSQAFARIDLDQNGNVCRLQVDYPLGGLEETRRRLMLRRCMSVLAAEERRIYSLTDGQAIDELDALTKQHDKDCIRTVEQS